MCALRGPQEGGQSVQLLVATIDGFFYQYGFDLTIGGECQLERVCMTHFKVRLYTSYAYLIQENILRESENEEIQAAYLA